MPRLLLALLLAILATTASAVRAGDSRPELGSLRIGAAAPAVAASKWVKGEPVAAFEKGKVYAIEFWATWCGPCIAAMPHVRDLQEKHHAAGFRVVSVTGADPNNTLEKVEKFVARKGDGMNYTVAFDDETRTRDAYLRGTARSGIPATFLVDREGRLAWLGHPKDVDRPLEQILAGTWDIDAAKTRFDAQLERDVLSSTWYEAVGARDARTLEAQAPAVFAAGHDDPEWLTAHAWAALAGSNELRITVASPVLPVLTRALERSIELRGTPHAFTLNALARARFLSGRRDDAVQLVRDALAAGKDEGEYLLGYLKQFLAEYEAAE